MKINSLHIRVSLSVAAAALLLVLGSSYFFYQHIYQNSLSDSRRSVQQLLATVRAPAAIAAYVGNRELAQQVVEGLVENDIVEGASIRASNEQLGHQGKSATAAAETISLELKSPFAEEETVGQLTVVANLPLIALRARDAALANTASLAALAAFVALLVMLMVYWMMSRPLAQLSNRLHQITPGDGSRLQWLSRHRGDEIGLLVSDINNLLITLETMLDEERQLRHRVELLETRFRGLFEDSSAGIFLVQDNGQLVTANPAFYRLTQMPQELESTLNIEQVFAVPDQVRSLLQLAQIGRRPCSGDFRLERPPAEPERWLHCIFSPAGKREDRPMLEGVMYDITQRKLAEDKARRQAEKDSLTGLANRQAIESAINLQIRQAQANGKGFVILMIDLDRFKYINDSYGHDAGDRVLREIAKRLQQQVRESDLVARLGGDEFLILLKNTDHIPRAEAIASAILSRQQAPIEVQPGQLESLGMSIGIASYPEHGDSEMTLRRHADQAMYAVKHQGKNGYAVYQNQASQSRVESTKM